MTIPLSVQCVRVANVRGEILDQSMQAHCQVCREPIWISKATRELAKVMGSHGGVVHGVCDVCKRSTIVRPAGTPATRKCGMCSKLMAAVIATSNGVEITKCMDCDVRRCKDCDGKTVTDPFVKRCSTGHHLVG